MEKFDLERAKRGVPLITRSGTKAEFLCILKGGQPAPLLIKFSSQPYADIVRIENYYLNGRYGIHDHAMDLFMNEL